MICTNRLFLKDLVKRIDIQFIVFLFLIGILAEYYEVFSFPEEQTLSFRHSARAALKSEKTSFSYDKITFVFVDDAFYEEYGRFPLTRTDLAKIVTNLTRLGAQVIGIDMLFKFPSAYGEDPALARALKEAGKTVTASQVVLDKNGNFAELVHPNPLIKQSTATGYVNFAYAGAGTMAMSRMRIYPEIISHEGEWPFSIRVLSHYLGVKPALVKGKLILGNIAVPLTHFNEIHIDFPAIPGDSRFIHELAGISALEFLDISNLDEDERVELKLWVENKIILIGDTATVSNDWFDTPMGKVYGVEVMGDTIHTLLKGAPLRPVSIFFETLCSFIFLTIITICCITIQDPKLRTLIVLLIFAAYMFFCTAVYIYADGIISMIYTLVTGTAAYLSTSLYSYIRDRKRKLEAEEKQAYIRGIFGRYLSDEIVQTILDTSEGLKLGGERRKVTVMLTDLRGFTGLGERLTPEEVVSMLNNYLEEMTSIILKYHGTIDNFIGDAILVIFGAPLSQPDDARRAAACAVEMQLAMDRVNQWNVDHGLPEIEMGIGLNTGDVVVGNIGSEKRSQYEVIGRTVNHTARVEAYTVGGQILISQNTYDEISADLRVDRQTEIMPKGVREPITIYELGGIGGEYNLFLPVKNPEIFTPPQKKLYVEMILLTGKHADPSNAVPGIITGLADSGKKAEIRSELPVEILKNLKLTLMDENKNIVTQDLYGKIIAVKNDSLFAVHFTMIPPEAQSLFTGS